MARDGWRSSTSCDARPSGGRDCRFPPRRPLDTAPEKTGPTRGERIFGSSSADVEPFTPSSRLLLAAYRGAQLFIGSPERREVNTEGAGAPFVPCRLYVELPGASLPCSGPKHARERADADTDTDADGDADCLPDPNTDPDAHPNAAASVRRRQLRWTRDGGGLLRSDHRFRKCCAVSRVHLRRLVSRPRPLRS